MSDSIQVAAAKITAKHKKLKQQNFDLGPKTSQVIDVDFGGYYQDFQKGRIYSHHSVGTFEVHGGILAKYKTRGEFGTSILTRRRELGFPKTDEKITKEGFPISLFEWGEILFIPNTSGGVAISGPIYNSWNAQKRKTYGYPVTSNVLHLKSEIVFFERGICIFNKSISQTPLWIPFSFPLLGNPGITKTDLSDLPIKLTVNLSMFNAFGGIDGFNKLLKGRIALRQVGATGKIRSLKIVKATQKNSLISGIKVSLILGSEAAIINIRFDHSPKLYDFVCKNELSTHYNLSPHCIYTRKNWINFGILHATDIHASRRIDSFKKKLKEAKVKFPDHAITIDPAITEINNWNNGFRDFIRYANAMHKKGVVDGIIATGDIVDYLFETGDNLDGGGNFKFFKDLILGKIPYPERENNQEELLVPIFTCLGNHDYRIKPYQLYQRIDIPFHPDKDVKQFGSFNLSRKEARILQGGNPNKFNDDDEGRLKVSTNTAKEQVIPATKISYWKKDYLSYYKTYINNSLNTQVLLDNHKIILLDTGSDVGSPDGSWDTWDAITTAFGFGDSDEEAFQIRHAPNSHGPNINAYNILKQIKSNDGVVILGMHAPPINTFGNEYPHYFRETEHVLSDVFETVNYIRRHSGALFQNPISQNFNNALSMQVVNRIFPNWLTNSSAFKFGSNRELLDEGVSRGDIMTFLKLICGFDGSKKAIDVLLCGHDHTRSEIRIKWNSQQDRMEYFTDFYTENPERFHNSKKYKGELGQYDLVKIAIKEGAPLNQPVSTIKEVGQDVKYLEIPPYKDPLSKASNKEAWWQRHKPLLIQGAPLGPTEHTNRTRKLPSPSQPSNEGSKLLIIRNNQIDKILHISRREMSKSNYEIPNEVQPVTWGNVLSPGGPIDQPILQV